MRATELQELEAMAAELLRTSRKLPPGPDRHSIIKRSGGFERRSSHAKAPGCEQHARDRRRGANTQMPGMKRYVEWMSRGRPTGRVVYIKRTECA